MSEKQRADHVQAKYWGGPISRAEAQKVFDEYSEVIKQQAFVIQKMDAVLSYVAEKFGFTHKDVEEWLTAKIKENGKSSLEKAVEKVEANQVIAEA